MRGSLFKCAALVLLTTCKADGPPEEDESEEQDMENAKMEMMSQHMSARGAGLASKFGCAHFGEWKGSCDINADDSIRQAADWSIKCDPWKIKAYATNLSANSEMTWSDDGDFTPEQGKHPWTCPEKYRSPSGCGDFRLDTRSLKCEETTYKKKVGYWTFDRTSGYREERIILNTGEPLLPQKHICVQRPLFFENRGSAESTTPPMLGRHRERWPAWGEYEFLPAERWLHAIEHGGITFLYNQCLKEHDLCLIRRYIQKMKYRVEKGDLANSRFRGADRGSGKTEGPGEFRFVLTPFKDLERAFAVVTWSEMYLSKGFNEEEIDSFIFKNYRHSWEDYQTSGPYDYLLTNISEKDTSACAADVDLTHVARKWEAAPSMTISEIMDIKGEQRFLQRLAITSLVVSVASCFAMAVMMLVVLRLLKHRGGGLVHGHLEQDETSPGYNEA